MATAPRLEGPAFAFCVPLRPGVFWESEPPSFPQQSLFAVAPSKYCSWDGNLLERPPAPDAPVLPELGVQGLTSLAWRESAGMRRPLPVRSVSPWKDWLGSRGAAGKARTPYPTWVPRCTKSMPQLGAAWDEARPGAAWTLHHRKLALARWGPLTRGASLGLGHSPGLTCQVGTVLGRRGQARSWVLRSY